MTFGSATMAALPRSPGHYFRSPGWTIRKIREWVSARFWLRSCDAVGPWTRVMGRVFVQNGGSIRIGERVQILSHYSPTLLATFPGGLLEIGDRTFVNYGADICATKHVRLGDDCLIGTHVIILDSDFHEVEHHDRMPPPRPVIIGNRVWIGNRATILPGVTIGDDAVIGAGSVVVNDVPPRTLAAGNPARIIKTFSPDAQ